MQKAITEGFRLSPQQRRLWLLQREGGHRPYRTQCAIMVEGDLDTRRLRAALVRVVERYEILRTNFQSLPGMAVPVQVIGEPAISLDERRDHLNERRDDEESHGTDESRDLHGLRALDERSLVETALAQARRESFDLEDGSPLHASLLALAPGRHLLLVGLPAMCADSCTLKNLALEIGRCYAGREGAEELEEPLQYADVAEWQNEIIESEDAVVGKEVWREQSLLARQTLRLPFELQPLEKVEFDPRVLTIELSRDARTKVASLVERCGTSASSFFLACWQSLLYRITLWPEMVVGVGFDGRNYAELEDALGLLARCLPVRTSLDERRPFVEVLRAAHQSLCEAARWQECFTWEPGAFENGSGEDFFSLGFEFHEQPPKYSSAGVSFSIHSQYVCTDRFKIRLSCWQCDEAMRAEFYYDASLIPSGYVECLSEQFQTLLDSTLRKPEACVGELEILSDAERRRLLAEYDGTCEERWPDACVHRLFEEQAAARPGALALVFEDERLTYGELNARANQLAHHLRSLGVVPEARVGILLERSVEMVVALLGVLKAGAAYVPLEPSLPGRRLAFMLEDAGVEILLTRSGLRESLPARAGSVVCLDSDWEKVARARTSNTDAAVEPSNLAYVIYTSGSTGTPKGVCIEHRQLLNYVRGVVERLRLAAVAQFAMTSTFAADLGNTVLFPSLCAGACLHVISHERASDAEALAEYFGRHPADCMKIVPSHLKSLLASASRPERILPRRVLVLGGESSDWDLIETVSEHAPGCAIFNHYGPTETTVGALAGLVPDERRSAAKAVPLGRALPDARVYTLDSRMSPAPVGVAGELHIGGRGVARGYLGRPDLTAEKFLPDPFSEEPGARMYRTGDMARCLPEGGLEFLGRNDHQVKVRGFRVELAEIEHALLRHTSVREALAAVHEADAGERRVVAYVVAKVRPAPSSVELRSFLRERLPEYMIPSAFVALDALPLTPNGKVDRRRLPAPDLAQAAASEYAAPLNEIEDILSIVWQKVLNLEVVGVHDDYFALGGDSIRVIQIVHEVGRYNLPLTAMDVFQHPTIHALARHISESRGRVEGARRVPLELVELPTQLLAPLPADIEDAYPASKMQEFVIRHYACDRQKMGVYHIQHAYHIRDEALSLKAFRRALEILVQEHAALRTFFVETRERGLIQAVKRRLAFTLREEHIEDLSAEEQERFVSAAVEADRARAFDVTNTGEPLFRFTAFVRSESTMEFLMSVHHAVTDGWGNRELTNELIELYQSLKSSDERARAAAAPNTYKEFVALEREIISSDAARDFWREHLSAARTPDLRPLPTPDLSPETNYFVSLETELAKRVRGLSRDLRVSTKAIFLSAYLEMVGASLASEPVTVGVVSNGRSERLSAALKALGLFWNIIPFCSPAKTGDELAQVRAVQQLLIDAEQYARYPLAQILDDRQASELFSATFNFLHFHNMKGLPDEGGLSLLGMRAHDKFHFPLNYIVSINSFTGNIAFRVEYDKAYFTREMIRSMTDDYVGLLTRLCDLHDASKTGTQPVV